MSIDNSFINVINKNIFVQVNCIGTWFLGDRVDQRPAALKCLSFCSISVNFMHSRNGTDGRLNLHKRVWRCSSSVPLSMSTNILSMSVFTYNTYISAHLSCVFMSIEEIMWKELFICILVQLLALALLSVLPFIYFLSLPFMLSHPFVFALNTLVCWYWWHFSVYLKLLISLCSTWRWSSWRKQRVEAGIWELTQA